MISAGKMMDRAACPVRHKKLKEKGIIPKGTDKEATRCESESDGWVCGYGSFPSASRNIAVPGCFMLMKNSGNEAERMRSETSYYQGIADYIVTDSEADDCGLFGESRRQSEMTLITGCRNNETESQERQKMSWFTEKHKSLYRERSCTVGRCRAR